MDLGRATRGGQKSTVPTTRLMRAYSRNNEHYVTRHGTLRHPRRTTFPTRPGVLV